MKDWVINLTVVLADGTVIKTRRRPRKSSAGYNLNGLFVGSEGTLGLVTEATLKLAVVPEDLSVAVVTFPTIRDAASAAAEVMQTGIPIAAMEIMDEVQMRVVNLGGATAPKVWKEMPTLFFKFSGTKVAVKENIGLVQRITKKNKGSNFEFAKDQREQKLLWSARKESLWSMLALRKDGEEVCEYYIHCDFLTFLLTEKQGVQMLPSRSVDLPISSRLARRKWMTWVFSLASWATSATATSTRVSSIIARTRVSVRKLRYVSRIWSSGL